MKNCNNIFLRALKSLDIEDLARYSDDTDFPFSQSLPLQETLTKPPSSPLQGPIATDFIIGFAIMEGDRLIGHIHLSAINLDNSSCNITMGIARKDDRNRGIGSCALTMALRYAFVSLGLNQVVTDTLSSNESARRCLKKVGFQETGIEKNVFPAKRGFIHRHHFIISSHDFLSRYP